MMASKHFQQQRPKSNGNKLRAADRWSFLQAVDAPQWVDLSLEARSQQGNSHSDSWFEESHEHHAISLAGKNADMSWVNMCKSVVPFKKTRDCQGGMSKAGKKQNTKHPKVSDNRKSKAVNVSMPIKGPSCCTNTYSDASSMTSSSNASNMELNTCTKARRGSWRLCEDSNGTPTCGLTVHQRGRSSSSACYLSSFPRSSHSSGSANSMHTTSRSSNLKTEEVIVELSLLAANGSKSGEKDDHHPCEEPIANLMSEVSCLTKEDFSNGILKPKLRPGPNWHKVEELATTDCKKKPKNVDLRLVRAQHAAKETSKGCLKSGRQALVETRGFQARLHPRVPLSAGKENVPLLNNQTAPNLLQVKGKCSSLRALSGQGHASTETANSKNNAWQKRFGEDCFLYKDSKSQVGRSAATFEESISYPKKRGSFVLERKNASISQVSGVTDRSSFSTRECEKHLIALVAQHNQKIWMHGQQRSMKGFR